MKISMLLVPAALAVAFLAACEEESRPRTREGATAQTGGSNRYGHQATPGTATDFVTDATPTPVPSPTTAAPTVQETAPTPTPTPTPATTAATTPSRDIPYATPVPGRAGFVTSPFAPYEGYVDVRGYPPNTEVKDPYSGKIFLVP